MKIEYKWRKQYVYLWFQYRKNIFIKVELMTSWEQELDKKTRTFNTKIKLQYLELINILIPASALSQNKIMNQYGNNLRDSLLRYFGWIENIRTEIRCFKTTLTLTNHQFTQREIFRWRIEKQFVLKQIDLQILAIKQLPEDILDSLYIQDLIRNIVETSITLELQLINLQSKVSSNSGTQEDILSSNSPQLVQKLLIQFGSQKQVQSQENEEFNKIELKQYPVEQTQDQDVGTKLWN